MSKRFLLWSRVNQGLVSGIWKTESVLKCWLCLCVSGVMFVVVPNCLSSYKKVNETKQQLFNKEIRFLSECCYDWLKLLEGGAPAWPQTETNRSCYGSSLVILLCLCHVLESKLFLYQYQNLSRIKGIVVTDKKSKVQCHLIICLSQKQFVFSMFKLEIV